MDYCEMISPMKKVIQEKNCVRRIRFSTTMETTAEDDDSIKVYARIKPTDQKVSFLEFDSTCVKYKEIDKRGCDKTMKFSFHRVFCPKVNQNDLFQSTVDKEIIHLIGGEDRLLFSYGTSGSGKTYTMLGSNYEPGILPRCTMKLFMQLDEMIIDTPLCPDQGSDIRMMKDDEYQLMLGIKEVICSVVEDSDGKSCQSSFCYNEKDTLSLVSKLCEEVKPSTDLMNDFKYAVWISYLEVYNENIYDLLDVIKDRKPLKFGYDSKKNNYIKDLVYINVTSWMELWKVFIYGKNRLHMSETLLNKSSSRSHSVFAIKLLKLHDSGNATVSSLSICDLAGCERQKKAQNVGSKLMESRNINTSLMILNRCFSAVRENKLNAMKKIPPYRDSKLTLIFQKAFSYGEHIKMFVNLSQNSVVAEETKNVLKMSSVAQEMVKMMPKIQKIFLKPHSRFSMMCANPGAPFSSQNVQGHSGIMTLSSTYSSSNMMEETIKNYEVKIKTLEVENQKKYEEIKGLLEMLEDARSEYLNLENKYKESEKNLYEEELAYEDLESDLDGIQMFCDLKQNVIKGLESVLGKMSEENSNLEQENCRLLRELKESQKKLAQMEDVERYKNENEKLNENIQKLQEDIEKLKLSQNTSKPVKRALLGAVVHLESPQLSPDLLRDDDPGVSLLDNKSSLKVNANFPTKTPQSKRKGKKLMFNDEEFEELSGRSVRKVTRSVSKVKKPE